MRFAFTEDQELLRATVRQALADTCTLADVRAAASAEADKGRSAERWTALAAIGATGLLVPESLGGVGLGDTEAVGVLEETGWAGLPEAFVETSALAPPIMAAAAMPHDSSDERGQGGWAEEAASLWLRRIADGSARVGLGGLDIAPSGARATSVPVGSAHVGNGQADLCTPRVAGANHANVLVLAHADDAGWQVYVLEPSEVSIEPNPSIDTTRDLAAVTWAPRAARRIASGEQAEALVTELADRGALAAAAQLAGLADRMITMAADYARERQQFGKPIGTFQAVKHHLASARVKLEFAKPAVYRAADSLARGVPTRAHDCSLAKAIASDAADLAARVALQVHGAIGYTWECDLHLFLKRSWALSAAWGDAATHRSLVLRAVLSQMSDSR